MSNKVKEMEELDYFVLRNVKAARKGSVRAREILRDKMLTLFNKPKEAEKIIDFILEQLIDEHYCEKNLMSTYEDAQVSYIARNIPALKTNGDRFYASGDAHFFRKLTDKDYIFARMDGRNYGFEAALIVLTARKYLNEIITQGIVHPKDIAESLAERLETVPNKMGFTTMFMSVLDDKEILLTNVGDGETWIYNPTINSFRLCPPHGLVLGAGDSQLRAKNPYVEERDNVQPGYTLVSYTDGLCGKIGFDRNHIKNLVGSRQNLKTIVKEILKYSNSLIPIEPDDVTLIGVRLK